MKNVYAKADKRDVCLQLTVGCVQRKSAKSICLKNLLVRLFRLFFPCVISKQLSSF